MRCEDCPSELDEGLHERLHEWRAGQAALLGQPAFCVFTDKTLLAIAENTPDDEAALSRIAGVTARKLQRYGTEVLQLCAGAPVAAERASSRGMQGSAKSVEGDDTESSNK